ncbi:hypothetical protein V5H41_29150, partial [Salmonella enterica]
YSAIYAPVRRGWDSDLHYLSAKFSNIQSQYHARPVVFRPPYSAIYAPVRRGWDSDLHYLSAKFSNIQSQYHAR